MSSDPQMVNLQKQVDAVRKNIDDTREKLWNSKQSMFGFLKEQEITMLTEKLKGLDVELDIRQFDLDFYIRYMTTTPYMRSGE